MITLYNQLVPDRPKDRPILSVHTGDTHLGSTLAMWPPEVILTDNAKWRPSRLQLWYLDRWYEFWQDTKDLKEKYGAYLIFVSGGDEIDGDHHGTKQLTSAFEDDQDQAMEVVYQRPLEIADEIHFVRGTISHGTGTERYARQFYKAGYPVIPHENHYSRWIYTDQYHGSHIEVAHAPGTKAWVPHTRGIAASRHAQYTRTEYQDSDIAPPDIVIRHHVHYWQGPGCSSGTCCFFIPGWQGGSDWLLSKGVTSSAISHFIPGGLRILHYPEGAWQPIWWLRRPKSSVKWAKS